jgi:hypothetical protein
VRILKTIVAFLFLSLFIQGKAYSHVNTQEQKLVSKKQFSILKAAKTFSENRSNENSLLKRKLRPKGIEVSMPCIARHTFKQTHIYKEFVLPLTKNTCSSFCHCLPCKRGPPRVK